ncbi:MAG: LCP family protein [Chloroflexota bacterium]
MIHFRLRTALLSVLVIVLALFGALGWRVYTLYAGLNSITGVVVPRATDEPTITPAPFNGNQRINFLVLGSDNDRKKQEAHPLCQSMIVVSLDLRDNKVEMLSIPRDFYLHIPGHGMGKIDLACHYGTSTLANVQLARDTIEQRFGIPIDYYAWVGLEGFIKVVDTFRGVSVDAAYPILDDSYPNDLSSSDPYGYQRLFIPPGWQHLTGSQALEYVRSRHGDLIGDFGRSHRQQQVLLALQQKANVMNVLSNLPQLESDLAGNFRTELTPFQIYQLYRLSHRINRSDIQQLVLQAPTYCHYGTTGNGQSILWPNWRQITPAVHAMFAPLPALSPGRQVSPPSPPPKTSGSATPSPSVTPSPTVAPTATPTPTATPPKSALAAPRRSTLPDPLIYARDGNLVLMDRHGHSRQLTSVGADQYAEMPSLAPGGKRLAWVNFSPNVSDIEVLNLHSRHETQVTKDDNPLGVAVPDVRNNLWAAWPAWSNDGSTLVYSSDRAKLQFPPADIRATDLALWQRSQGGTLTQLTLGVSGGGGDINATWEPRGNLIAFVRWTFYASSKIPYSQLYVRNEATGSETALTPVGGRILDPTWDPAGDRLAFIRQASDGQDQVVVARFVSSHGVPTLQTPTVIAQGQVAQPSFVPRGRQISYVRADGDGFVLELAGITGGRSQILSPVTNLDPRSAPIWLR